MKRALVFASILLSTVVISGCTLKQTAKEAVNTAQQTADVATGVSAIELKKKADRSLSISKALQEFKARKFIIEDDLARGPCLSENLLPDWVADIAHNPRQRVDDESANQCQNFRNGTAKHFVELDLEGNLIRAE